MSMLEVQNLNVRYLTENGASEVIKDISFQVEKGEIVGLAGESGSGKSTAMLAVMGLLDGRAKIQCRTLSLGGGPVRPGYNAAMIFQDPLSSLNPSIRIGKQITETIRLRQKCNRKEAAARAEELLDMVGIHNPSLRMRQYPHELSGGMRQRVVLAITLACSPDLIIADEPTTALDAVVQAQILSLFKRIVRETGTSLLLVSHDMGVTAALCSRVYVMHQGKIVEGGSAEDIFYSPAEDYTKRLLADARGSRRVPAKAAESTPLIRLEHVTKTFDASEGIRDLSAEICKGEIFALAGESGSGKTTTAKVLTGILCEDSGHLYYKGKLLPGKNRMEAFGGRVQMVFQDPCASLNPGLTVRQALREALLASARRGGETPDPGRIDRKITDMLELTGISGGDADRYPGEFSGGQRQRIGIARALITGPELLVCDEALSSLDATTREQILDLLFDLQKKIGFACLFISHDMYVVRRISGRIGVMYGGRLVEAGSTGTVCSDPWHPYTKQLLESVPEPDPLRAAKVKAAPSKERGQDAGKGCPFAGKCGYAMECCLSEIPETLRFGERQVACFLYSEAHSGKRDRNYKMTSQI